LVDADEFFIEGRIAGDEGHVHLRSAVCIGRRAEQFAAIEVLIQFARFFAVVFLYPRQARLLLDPFEDQPIT